MNNYEQDIHIDEQALDIEWIEQPKLMFKYSSKRAQCLKEVDRLKEKLSVVRAELDKNIRSQPSDYDLDKITEAALQATILMQDEYKDAMEDLIEAQYEANMASAAVQALEHRKQALENLSKLLGLQYFAGPRSPRDLSAEAIRREQQRQVDRKVVIKRR